MPVSILNGSQSSAVGPGQLLRVTIRQAPAEVLLSPTLLLGLQSWRNVMETWARTLADSPTADVIPVSAPSVGGDPRLSTQTLVVDVRTRTASPTIPAGMLADRLDRSIPLGADLRTLDLSPPTGSAIQQGRDRDDAATDAARILPAIPGLSGGSSSLVLVLLAVGLGVFLLGSGARNLRQSVDP